MSLGDQYESQLRALKLELEKTRSQAKAARLEARAAELELEISRLGGTPDAASETPLRFDGDHSQLLVGRHSEKTNASASSTPPRDPASTFQSWGDVRSAVEGGRPDEVQDEQFSPEAPPRQVDDPSANEDAPLSLGAEKSPDHTLRFDPDHSDEAFDNALELDELADSDRSVRSRPAAWMISAVVHAGILLLLGIFTLSNQKPGDAVALAGSVAETDEIAIETISIETQQMEVSESDPVPSEMEYELSDVGELAITELAMDVPPAPPSPLLDSLSDSSATNQAMMSLKSDSDSTMKFCGVEGGGNHFVYLVDSSGSMGDAFESARKELLQSIDALQPNQKFYVIFFDAESDYMRLSSPDEDEPKSVYATPENKLALRRWAMTIQMDRGRAPYDALPFAIELRPDVIFLLSDGEFPQSIEDLLNDINRIENLFGDDDPISIVHTISYHSREGESRMRRLAKQHGGQYRHVPKP